MELTYVLVLFIVYYTTASPYGYGTKGGAAAKADATAVAGAYTGAGEIPVNILENAGYSGSFSKSYSSSSASSSAISSSSSFSYSDTGSIAYPGAINGGCISGNCHGSSAGGTQAHSGAIASSLSQGHGGTIPTGSYGYKYNHGKIQSPTQDCGSKGCLSGSVSLTNSGAGSQSTTGTNVQAAAESGLLTVGGNCGGTKCNNPPGEKCSSSNCDSNNNCSSGDCIAHSKDDGGSCKSGRCGSDAYSSSTFDNETNDIKVTNADTSNNKINHDTVLGSNYDKTNIGCSSGNCGSTTSADINHHNSYPAPGISTAPTYSKPAIHLSTPKLEPPCTTPSCYNAPAISPVGYGHDQITLDNTKKHDESNPSCVGGICGQTKPLYTNNASGLVNVKPDYSFSSSSTFDSVKQSGSSCVPGTPGCSVVPSAINSAPVSVIIKPSQSQGDTGSYTPIKSDSCTPGIDCGTGDSGCITGNCGVLSPLDRTSNINPSNPQGTSASYSTANPVSSGCTPGSPGCSIAPFPTSPSGCVSGYCRVTPQSAPTYGGSHDISTLYTPAAPSNPSCSPGAQGCGSASTYNLNNYGTPSSAKPSYNHALSPAHSPVSPLRAPCYPGTPGCITNSPFCTTGNCGKVPSTPEYGSSFNLKPSSPSCEPGTPGCIIASSSGLEGLSNLPINPADCVPGMSNCAAAPTSYAIKASPSMAPVNTDSYAIKPNYSHSTLPIHSSGYSSDTSCVPGKLGCSTIPVDKLPSSAGEKPNGCLSGFSGCGKTLPSSSGSGGYGGSLNVKPYNSQDHSTSALPAVPICSPGTLGCPSTIPTYTKAHASGYGVSGLGTSLTQGTSEPYGSNQTSQGKLSPEVSAFPNGPSGGGITVPSSTFTGYGSISSFTSGLNGVGLSGSNNRRTTAGISSSVNVKDKPYSGSFGGPAGILKPNEFSVPSAASISNKPLSSPILSPSTSPSCISGNCNQAEQTPSPLIHGDSNSVNKVSAGSLATADAVAYTGGFGGPPGLLKPYDDGKIDHKVSGPLNQQDSSYGPHEGLSGSEKSHSNGGYHTSENALAQANAATFSSVGGNGNGGAGGCGGSCGGSNGYNALDYSKTGVLDDSSNRNLANAGAVAKSIANASSGAKAYGASYATSSATAHATAGSSVKGGYGRR